MTCTPCRTMRGWIQLGLGRERWGDCSFLPPSFLPLSGHHSFTGVNGAAINDDGNTTGKFTGRKKGLCWGVWETRNECWRAWTKGGRRFFSFFFLPLSVSTRPTRRTKSKHALTCYRTCSAQWQKRTWTSGYVMYADYVLDHWTSHRPHIIPHRPNIKCPTMFGLCGTSKIASAVCWSGTQCIRTLHDARTFNVVLVVLVAWNLCKA